MLTEIISDKVPKLESKPKGQRRIEFQRKELKTAEAF